jgi:hypothetical protein
MTDLLAPRLELISRRAVISFIISIPAVAWALELGVALTPSHILGFAVIALAAATLIALRHRPVFDLISFSLVAFAVVATITVMRVHLQPDVVIYGESLQAKATKQLIGLWFAVGLFLGLRYLMETFRLGTTVLRVHFWTAVVVAVLALVQYGIALWDFGSGFAALPVRNSTLGETRQLVTGVQVYGFPRVALTLVEPSRLGTYLLTAWALWLYAAQRKAGGFLGSRWATISGIVLGAAVILTGSRAAHLVFACLALGAVLARPGRLQRSALVVASLVLAVVLIGPSGTAGVTTSLIRRTPPAVSVASGDIVPHIRSTSRNRRIAGFEDRLIALGRRSSPSTRHRVGSALVTLSVLRDRPWFGAGYGTSEFAMAMRYPPEMGQIVLGPVRPTMLGAYNTVVTETGVAGTLCLLGLLIGMLTGLWTTARSTLPGASTLAWASGAALSAYALAMSGLAIEVYQFVLVWALLAAAAACVTEIRCAQPTITAQARGRRVHPPAAFVLTSDR